MSIGSGSGDEVEAEAIAWAVRSAERELDEEEQHQLDQWLGQSSRNLGAYVRAQALWGDLDRVVALDNGVEAEEPPLRKWRRYAIAAAIAPLLILAGLAADRLPGRVSTDRAEVRELALPDGSTAVLDGDTTIQVRFGEAERRIVVRDGQAAFRVRHEERPFLVSAEDVTVRAVGTDFSVAVEDGRVELLVADGAVQVVATEDGETPRLIRANEQLVAGPSGVRRAEFDPAEVERRLAWRRGMLVFTGQMLGKAAQQVNRYSEVQVTIDDPTLARAEFLGVFRVGDGRAFATAAAQAFNGEIIERDGALHIMRARNSPSH